MVVLLSLLAAPAKPAAQETDAPAVSGEMVLKSYQYTYPEKVEEVSYRDGDWAIRIGGQLFYWAEGRLLPPDARYDWGNFRPHSFTPYPAEIPQPEKYTAAQIEAIRREARAEALDVEDYHRAFQGALYGGIAREEIERNLIRTMFLGKAVTVHGLIAEPLKRIGEVINRAAKQDASLAAFIASIESIGGYNWREIRGTRRRSYHSWGLALDILSSETTTGVEKNRAVYWRWELTRNNDWMVIPLSRRWKPPDEIIRAFENEGFIWGGKWPHYDTMHFEFRPEIHELNRLINSGEGSARIIRSESGRNLNHIFPLK